VAVTNRSYAKNTFRVLQVGCRCHTTHWSVLGWTDRCIGGGRLRAALRSDLCPTSTIYPSGASRVRQCTGGQLSATWLPGYWCVPRHHPHLHTQGGLLLCRALPCVACWCESASTHALEMFAKHYLHHAMFRTSSGNPAIILTSCSSIDSHSVIRFGLRCLRFFVLAQSQCCATCQTEQ
jgi:hypothetical protein